MGPNPTRATSAPSATTAPWGFRGLGPLSRHDERPRSTLSADKGRLGLADHDGTEPDKSDLRAKRNHRTVGFQGARPPEQT